MALFAPTDITFLEIKHSTSFVEKSVIIEFNKNETISFLKEQALNELNLGLVLDNYSLFYNGTT